MRDAKIDNLRGMLIVLVVIGHFLLPLHGAHLVMGPIYAIYIFHMPCFLMVSGFLSKSVMKDGHFRWGKAVQIFWLYLLYKTIVFFTEGPVYGFATPFVSLLHESGAPWYLMSLGTYYLFIPLFEKGRKYRWGILFLLFAGISFLKYLVHAGDFLSLDRTISFAPFFFFGYYCTKEDLERFVKSPLSFVFVLLGAVLLFLAYFYFESHFLKYNLVVYGADYCRYMSDQRQFSWLVQLIFYAAALSVSLGFVRIMPSMHCGILTTLGQRTLQIYILHRPIRDLLEWAGVYARINPASRKQVLLLIICSVLLTLILGNPFFTVAFERIRTVFDRLLEKQKAL